MDVEAVETVSVVSEPDKTEFDAIDISRKYVYDSRFQLLI